MISLDDSEMRRCPYHYYYVRPSHSRDTLFLPVRATLCVFQFLRQLVSVKRAMSQTKYIQCVEGPNSMRNSFEVSKFKAMHDQR